MEVHVGIRYPILSERAKRSEERRNAMKNGCQKERHCLMVADGETLDARVGWHGRRDGGDCDYIKGRCTACQCVSVCGYQTQRCVRQTQLRRAHPSKNRVRRRVCRLHSQTVFAIPPVPSSIRITQI